MASAPGGASQRLLTMKFMQRAAVAGSPTTPSTPASGSHDGHTAKRRKLGGRSSSGAPEAPSYVTVDQKAAQAALADEDRKRQAAMDIIAEQLGDSHWVLDTATLPSSRKQAGTPLKIVQVGFSEIDRRGSSEEGQEKEEEEEARVFQSFGPKKKARKEEQNHRDSDSESDGDSDLDKDSDSPGSDFSSEESVQVQQSKPGRSSYGSQRRDEIRSKRAAAQEKSRKLASARRTKHVDLHKLTSISGAGSYGSKGRKGSKPSQRR